MSMDIVRCKRSPRPKTKPLSCEDSWHSDAMPFVVLILYKSSGRFLCMGSIIDSYHVLTVKRCFEQISTDLILVVAGYVRPYWGRNSQVKTVQQIIRHEKELALLKLQRPFLFSDYVKPAILINPGGKALQMAEIYGGPYGVIGIEVQNWELPGQYMPKESYYEIRDEPPVAIEDCAKNYSSIIMDNARMFCTQGNSTFCWGSTGGPVVKLERGDLVQLGVVYLSNCTINFSPLIVVRTDVHDRWIRSNSDVNGGI